MDEQEQQLVERIKQAQNVLVTVSTNPSVDQLAAAIGLTIALNKLNKHGTAVYSGVTPSTIEFLKPEDTLEKNTDSLRDFIIALDKSKADKLRYKVEDQVVRIFITPYRTSISDKDLQFSQGDFNVDVVVALGVASQQELDAAITAHGRILHDATVTTVSTGAKSDLGTINWVDPQSSSLCEMMLYLMDGLDKSLLDNQIATALLTGIVATTDRFRNEKTTPETMQVSAELMAAGANQQLIATELETAAAEAARPQPIEEAHDVVEPEPPKPPAEPGELDIDHEDDEVNADDAGHGGANPPLSDDDEEDEVSPEEYRAPAPEPGLGSEDAAVESNEPQIHVDENGVLSPVNPDSPPLPPLPPLPPQAPIPSISQVHGVKSGGTHGLTVDPATSDADGQNGQVTAAALTDDQVHDEFDERPAELTLPPVDAAGSTLLTHNESVLPAAPAAPSSAGMDNGYLPQAPLSPLPPAPSPMSSVQPLPPMPPVPMPTPPPMPAISPASASLIPSETLEEIEEAVHSPHVQQAHRAQAAAAAGLNDARSAVQAALGGPTPVSALDEPPLPPITALNALPLGDMLHTPAPAVPSSAAPAPGVPPADHASDVPSPSNPFGLGQPPTPPASSGGIPPVPPPFVPPLQ